MERGAHVPFEIGCTDPFTAPRVGDTRSGDRRERERSLVAGYGTCVIAWLLAYLTATDGLSGAAGQSYPMVESLLRVVHLAAVGVGALAALSAVWAHVAHLGFLRRNVAR